MLLRRTDPQQVKQHIVAQFLREANSFVVSSYEAIARSAPHIYVSALPFTAKGSLIGQYFGSQCTGVVSVETFGIADHGEGLVMILTGHKDSVSSISYSLNGRNLASGSDDRTVRVWDTSTGEETMPAIRVDHGFILAIAFVMSDTGIAVCTSDGVIRVRDISTGHDLQYRLCNVTTRVTRASFSPDRTLVASASWDGKVQICSIDDGEQVSVLRGPITRPTEISFSCNDRLAAAFSVPPMIRIWASRTSIVIGDIVTTGEVKCLSISPDGKVLAAGNHARGIEVWDLDTMARIFVSSTGNNSAFSLAFSPDALHLAAACHDGIQFWNWHSKQQVALLQGHADQINSVSYSSDGWQIASASNDRTIRIWNVGGSGKVVQPLAEPSGLTCMAVSPDNTYIVSGASDGSVHIWCAESGQPKLEPLLGHQGSVVSVAISSNGQSIASRSDAWNLSVIRFWNAQTGEAVGELNDSSVGNVSQEAFSPDTSQPASVSVVQLPWAWLATVYIWNLGKEYPSLSEFSGSIAFSSDGLLFAATVGRTANVHVWQTHHGISCDSTKVVAHTEEGTLQFKDINSRQPISDHTDDLYEYATNWIATSSPNRRLIDRMLGTTMQSWVPVLLDAAAATSCDIPVRGSTVSRVILIGGKDRIMAWKMDAVNSLAAGSRCNPLTQLLCGGPQAGGWVKGPSGELLLWVPPEYHAYVQLPPCKLMISKHRVVITADATGLCYGGDWKLCWQSAARASCS